MIRILSIDSPDVDGVSWWRNIRPLTELQRANKDIQIKFAGENVTLHDLMQTDIVIMFRPTSDKSLKFLENCKNRLFSTKVIIDIDDNLWRLPPGHPSEADYAANETNLRKIYAMADGIWCSTESIMPYADALDGRGVVVKNAVLERDFPTKPARYNSLACWRGSQSQFADIENRDSIEWFERSADMFKKWLFWGYYPASMRKMNTAGMRRVDLIQYISSLPTSGINVMWKPLQENEFNDAKSNIAWLEATLAGGICVTNYAGKKEWEMACPEFSNNEDFIAHQWKLSRDWAIDKYNLEGINKTRYNHILSLLK